MDIQALIEPFESLKLDRTNLIHCLEPLRSECVWLGYKKDRRVLVVTDESNSKAAIVHIVPPEKPAKAEDKQAT